MKNKLILKKNLIIFSEKNNQKILMKIMNICKSKVKVKKINALLLKCWQKNKKNNEQEN